MSIYPIKAKKTVTINTQKYNVEIKKDVKINFIDADYRVCPIKDEDGIIDAFELIPDSTDFLRELYDIFPSDEYDIRIIQEVYGRPYVSIHLDIKSRMTGEKVFLAENAVLSDRDYDYIRNFLVNKVPQYDWETKNQYICSGIECCIKDECNSDLFTSDAAESLAALVASHYREVKTDGYVDYDYDLMNGIRKEVLEEALRNAYEQQF